MAAPPPSSLTTPDDLVPTAADFADNYDILDGVPGGFGPDGGGSFGDESAFDDEDLVHAATKIQSIQRGKRARGETSKISSASPNSRMTPSQTLTFDIANSCSSGLAPTADGLSYACKVLRATELRLAGELRPALQRLPNLTSVDLSDNRLVSLRGLDALPLLCSLVCRRNRLRCVLDFAAPVSSPPTPSRLRFADLRENRIAGAVSLPPDASSGKAIGVDAHTALEVLRLDGNELRSLRGIESVPHLTTLTAAHNQLVDTAAAGTLVHLKTLDLSNNGLTTCAELASMVSLHTASLAANQLTALPDLSALTELRTLELAGNELSSLTALAAAIGGAKSPLLSASPLSALSVAGNPLCHRRHDLRLEIFHLLPNLTSIDGVAADAHERVSAHNMHGSDTDQLKATRRQYFNDGLGTAEADQLPKLMQLYRNQYTQAFIKGDLKLGWRD